MKHIRDTRPLQRFSSPPSRAPASSNIVQFPRRFRSQSRRSLGIEHPDWKERRITSKQRWYIRLLAGQAGIRIQDLDQHCYREFGADLSTMTRPMASDVIQGLKRKYYKAQSRNTI